jgi:hypothetical protein
VTVYDGCPAVARFPLPPPGAAPAIALRWRDGGARLDPAPSAAGPAAREAGAAEDGACRALGGGAVCCEGLAALSLQK